MQSYELNSKQEWSIMREDICKLFYNELRTCEIISDESPDSIPLFSQEDQRCILDKAKEVEKKLRQQSEFSELSIDVDDIIQSLFILDILENRNGLIILHYAKLKSIME